jgi:hypothetical protein
MLILVATRSEVHTSFRQYIDVCPQFHVPDSKAEVSQWSDLPFKKLYCLHESNLRSLYDRWDLGLSGDVVTRNIVPEEAKV